MKQVKKCRTKDFLLRLTKMIVPTNITMCYLKIIKIVFNTFSTLHLNDYSQKRTFYLKLLSYQSRTECSNCGIYNSSLRSEAGPSLLSFLKNCRFSRFKLIQRYYFVYEFIEKLFASAVFLIYQFQKRLCPREKNSLIKTESY